MKVRWIGRSMALLPIIIQLTWLPYWRYRGDRPIADVSYFILCLISGAVGTKFGLRDAGPPHWSKELLRLLVFLGIVALGFSAGVYSGCAVI